MHKELLQDPRVVCMSHRGNARDFPENTLESFDCAVADGFPLLETDLRATSDGHIVLSHDRTLTRVAGVGRNVDEMSRSELEKVELPGGCRLLFLDQFIDRYPAAHWVFDLKHRNSSTTVRNLADLLSGRGDLQQKITMLCWSRKAQIQVQSLLGLSDFYARKEECARAAFSILGKIPGLGGIEKGKAYAILPEFAGIPLFRKKIIDQYHKRGGRVIGFLPGPEEANRAVEAGVDILLLDYWKSKAE